MKTLQVFLLLACTMGSTFCYGQKPDGTFVDENGIIFRYEGNKKTGTRYDEYCKTTFDIYTVTGTVTNNNTDKAAVIKAILNFTGSGCNKIYSDNAPISGEIKDKLFSLDVVLQSKHTSPYWVNRFVQLGPNGDKMIAYGYVEVKQGDPCPEPDPIFTYELIPGKSSPAPANTEEPAAEGANPGNRGTTGNEDSTDVTADGPAKFPGGITAFSNAVVKRLDFNNITGSGKIQTVVAFVINKDGSVSDVEATGANESFNKEAVRALSAVKTPWTPAKVNGLPIRYRLRLPLAVVL